MNQTFSFNRWSMLVSKHWVENRRRYLLSLLAIAGLMIAWYCFILTMDAIDPLGVFFQYITYYGGLYFVGCLYASMLFADLQSKTAGIGWLSLPASTVEKLLCALLFGVFLFFIAYTLVFYLVDIPMVQLSNKLIESHPRTWPNSDQFVPELAVYNVFSAKAGPALEPEYHIILLGFFAVQAVFVLGSVYFTRNSFIKTIVVVLLFLLILILLFLKLVGAMLPAGWHYTFFHWDQFDSSWKQLKTVRLPAWTDGILVFLLQYSLPFIFWIITYIRLKEKEV
jgi:hypothetical protein